MYCLLLYLRNSFRLDVIKSTINFNQLPVFLVWYVSSPKNVYFILYFFFTSDAL